MSEVQYGSIRSGALGKQMPFSIYLPDGYGGNVRFPALYFLHGRSGNEGIMAELGIQSVADGLIASKQISPIVIVCPRMDNSRGLNTSEAPRRAAANGMTIDMGKYKDYFIKEVIPYIDRHFKTMPNREYRYVGGASAGGFAATHYGLQCPELFSRIGGHMPAIETELDASDVPYYGDEAGFHASNPLAFDRYEELHQHQRWYLDAGEQDEGGFNKTAKSLSDKLRAHGVSVEHHIFPGHHNLQYIKDNIQKYLVFYGAE
ncbi:MAG: esterase family protein [Prevotella sp.]|nr:esterase family protein [Prevotella sp.]